MRKNLFLLFTALVGFCSCSEDSEGVYDEVLSNTVWTQTYIEPLYTISEDSDHREYWKLYLSVLKSESLPVETKYDTLWSYYNKGNYLLSFKNDRCEMKDTYQRNGEYRVKTLKVSPAFYPDQEFKDTSINGGISVSLEVIVKKDSVFVTESSEDSDRTFSFKLDEENIFYVDIEEVGVSDYYDYEGEPETETYNMTFTRNGNKVLLTGDRNMTGTLNDSMDEIDFDEMGTVYRQ